MFQRASPSLLCALIALIVGAPSAWAQATPSDYLAEMDADHDGHVSLAEYQDWLSAAFRAMDRNGNGVIDLNEFDPAVVTAHTQPLSLTQHRRNLEMRFRLQDVDRDGYLNARELGAPPR
jgi:Ca2+-binding EF-hand superfamily protein